MTLRTITSERAEQLVREGYAASSEERRVLAQERLFELTRYVREHSRYFGKLYADLPASYGLSDLPVTTKAGLMEDFEAWVTDPEITLAGVREYLADPENVKQPYLGRYSALTTSGTTGEPMPMIRDNCHNIIHGMLMTQRFYRGIDPKDIDPYYTKTAAVIATGGFVSSYSSAMRVKNRLGERADNLQIFSLLLPIEQLVEKLNAHDPKFLTGYPSTLLLLAKEKQKGTLKISPGVIASSAEKLSPEMFGILKETFGCIILNNYCSTEGGEIAMACRQGSLHLNEDWIVLEPVDENCAPSKPGEWSSGVLVTDLTNYVQPIIRYYVSDCIIIGQQPCKCGNTLPVVEISGRMGDILEINGKSLTFPVFYVCLSSVPELLKWQIIQTGADCLEVRFFERTGADRSAVGAGILETMKEMMLKYNCGNVEITISDEDFVKTRGGKVPYVLSRRD